MPYLLTAFDAVPLPRAMPVDDLSTGPVESTLQNSIGGVYDYAGSARRLPKRHEFTHKGIYEGQEGALRVRRVTPQGDVRVTPQGDTRIIESTTFANLQAQTDDLKAKIGVRGQLWRQRINDNVLQWKRCRLLQVQHVEEVEQAGVVSEVESRFETLQVGWKAVNATLTNDVTPASLNVFNSGLLPVFDGILRVTHTSGTITQVRITGSGVDITWNGSLGAGQILTIDSGAQTVTVGAADAYSGFVLGAPHSSPYWLPLNPGLNGFTVTVTGGVANLQFEHYDQFP
jgi:hypothetical protein